LDLYQQDFCSKHGISHKEKYNINLMVQISHNIKVIAEQEQIELEYLPNRYSLIPGLLLSQYNSPVDPKEYIPR